MRITPIGMIAIILSGCGHVPFSSIPKLTRLDMMTLDIEQLRIAVDSPPGLQVRQDSATIVVGLKQDSGKPPLEERIVLREIGAQKGDRRPKKPPSTRQVFHVAAQDLDRIEALQKTIRTRKQSNPKGTKGYLTVTSGACRTHTLPAGPLLVTTLLQTANDDAFFVLTRNVDLRTVIPERLLQEEIPLC